MFQVPFVARERELAVLDAVLKDTLNGRFNAALISGSAGSGKSALAEEFLRRAQAQNPGLRVAIGGCNAQSGAVTPYLPFMDIVAQLSGTADSRDAGQGPPTKGMLKTATAVALKSLVEIGPDLIGTFVPAGELIGKGILEVARQAGWLAKLEESGKPRPPVDKERLLDQYVAVLADLGRHYPLLLVVDDMQWIDASSLELFNRILRRISGTPLFVLGMLRPLEDPAPSDDGRQRFKEAIGELKVELRETTLDLDALSEADLRAFVAAYLGACQNRFPEPLAEEIFKKTGGHPLFLAEFLKSIEESGSIWKDGDGFWRSVDNIDWTRLPNRLEEVLSHRLAQVGDELGDLLTLACVEGETFSVPVLAGLAGRQELEVLKLLARLERRHNLVRQDEIVALKIGWNSRYAFNSTLLSQHLYQTLGRRERMLLHLRVAQGLEALYAGQETAVANELATHFGRAEEALPACRYARDAGVEALRLGAYPEAVEHFQAARSRLERLPHDEAGDALRAQIHIHYCNALKVVRGWNAPEVAEAGAEARAAFSRSRFSPEMGPFLFNEWAVQLLNMDLKSADAMARDNLRLGERMDSPEIRIQGRIALGNTAFWMGRFKSCVEHMAAAQALLSDDLVAPIAERYGQDMRIFIAMFQVFGQWALGQDAEEARWLKNLETLTAQAPRPFDAALGLHALGWHRFHRNDPAGAGETAGRLVDLCTKSEIPQYLGFGQMLQGWAQAVQGDPAGLERLDEGFRRVPTLLLGSLHVLLRAQAMAALSRDSDALRELEAALPGIRASGCAVYLKAQLILAAALNQKLGNDAGAQRQRAEADLLARAQMA